MRPGRRRHVILSLAGLLAGTLSAPARADVEVFPTCKPNGNLPSEAGDPVGALEAYAESQSDGLYESLTGNVCNGQIFEWRIDVDEKNGVDKDRTHSPQTVACDPPCAPGYTCVAQLYNVDRPYETLLSGWWAQAQSLPPLGETTLIEALPIATFGPNSIEITSRRAGAVKVESSGQNFAEYTDVVQTNQLWWELIALRHEALTAENDLPVDAFGISTYITDNLLIDSNQGTLKERLDDRSDHNACALYFLDDPPGDPRVPWFWFAGDPPPGPGHQSHDGLVATLSAEGVDVVYTAGVWHDGVSVASHTYTGTHNLIVVAFDLTSKMARETLHGIGHVVGLPDAAEPPGPGWELNVMREDQSAIHMHTRVGPLGNGQATAIGLGHDDYRLPD